ncbi:unnamed protein product, partial [Mesorhabditis spiculigera]
MKPVLRRIMNVGSCDYVVSSNHLFPRIRSLLGGRPDCCYIDEFDLPMDFFTDDVKKVARDAPGFVEMEWPEDNDAMAEVQEAFRRYVPVSKKPISVERDRQFLKKEKLGPVFSCNFYREAGCSAGLTIMVTVHLVHGADGKAYMGKYNYDVAITVMDNTHHE